MFLGFILVLIFNFCLSPVTGELKVILILKATIMAILSHVDLVCFLHNDWLIHSCNFIFLNSECRSIQYARYLNIALFSFWDIKLCWFFAAFISCTGHIGITVDDTYKACERFERLGVEFVKKPDDGIISFKHNIQCMFIVCYLLYLY